MKQNSFSHVVGFDDCPFPRSHRGYVRVVGAVFAGLRLEGVLCGRVTRDGTDATRNLSDLISTSKYAKQLQLILLQGVALAGFNVIDLHGLNQSLDIPVLVVVRRAPRMDKVRRALLDRVPGGEQKWALIERLGAPEPVADVYVQRAGLSQSEAQQVLRRMAVHGNIPEPIRTAHLIAGAIAEGQSRGRT